MKGTDYKSKNKYGNIQKEKQKRNKIETKKIGKESYTMYEQKKSKQEICEKERNTKVSRKIEMKEEN